MIEYIITTSEYCTRVTDGTHDTPKPSDAGFPLVTSRHITGGILDLNSTYLISENDYISVNQRSKVEQWDILFSMIGSVGEVYIERTPNPEYAIKNLGLFKMNGNRRKALNLYYYLKSSYFQKKLKFWLSGSIQSFVSLGFLRNIKLPHFNEKTSEVVDEIELYTHKISTNLSLIHLLEEYSELLFRKWFIDFNFPDDKGNPYKDSGGEMEEVEGKMIPKGWITKPLIEIAEFINGLAMQSYPPQGEQDKLPVIKIKEINNGGFHKDTEYVTKSVDQKLIIENGDILFPWSGSLCVKIWSGGTGCLNQHIFKVESKEYKRWFLYQWIKRHMPYFEQIAYGKKTTMGHINRRHLSLVNIFIPRPETLSKMDVIMDTLYNKILLVGQENKLLEETRDLLIKKLIK